MRPREGVTSCSDTARRRALSQHSPPHALLTPATSFQFSMFLLQKRERETFLGHLLPLSPERPHPGPKREQGKHPQGKGKTENHRRGWAGRFLLPQCGLVSGAGEAQLKCKVLSAGPGEASWPETLASLLCAGPGLPPSRQAAGPHSPRPTPALSIYL